MKNKFLIMLISIMLVSLIAASILGYIENNKRSNNVVDNSNTIDDETTDEEKVNENGDKVLSFYSRSDLNTLVVGKCNNTSKCTYITDYTCKNKNCRVLALSKNYALINDGSIVLSNVRYNDNNDIQNLSLNNYKIQLIENNDQIYGMIVDDNNKKAFYSFADRMYTIPFGDYQIYPVEPQNAEWRLDGLILIDYNSDSYPVVYFKSDTTGEKAYEEFYVPSEKVNMNRFMALGVVEQTTRRNMDEVNKFFTELEAIFASPEFTKAEVVESIKRFIPNFEHEEKGKNLDQKM